MATRNTGGIEFSILPETQQRPFRLLELPAELLELITSENGPSCVCPQCKVENFPSNELTSLELKSLQGSAGHELESSTVLCTPTTTYTVRQVNTSNTLYITQISADRKAGQHHTPALEAVAQPQSTIEVSLLPHTAATPYIQAVLPIYASNGHYDSKAPQSKRDLFSNIPLSEAECESGWEQLACFETDADPRAAVIPSVSAKLRAWEALIAAATLSSIDLTEPLNLHDQSVIVNGDREWPVALSQAVLRSMAQASGEEGALQVDEVKCVRSVGLDLLRDRTEQSGLAMPTATFLTAWTDLLPEKWRGNAGLKALDGKYALSNDGQDISSKESERGEESAAPGDTSSKAKSTLGAKRKWHEKFRAAKKPT